jgi:hypothetical protein
MDIPNLYKIDAEKSLEAIQQINSVTKKFENKTMVPRGRRSRHLNNLDQQHKERNSMITFRKNFKSDQIKYAQL